MIKILYNQYLIKIILFSALIILSTYSAHAFEEKKWICYYSDEAKPSEFYDYDLLIFDSDYHPQILPLSSDRRVILGYISLGEVEKERAHYQEIKEMGILSEENQYWKGSYFVDVRDKRWVKKVIEELIPDLLFKGFDGVFMDTLDNPAHMERMNPEKYAGMRDAAVDLVKAIRYHFPDIKIMMNRGYELLPDLVDVIDMELGESVYADYDFETKKYSLVESELYKKQVEMLQDAKVRNPNLKIYTLDYWNSDDESGIKNIYAEQRKNGFNPYVSTIDLKKIIKEP